MKSICLPSVLIFSAALSVSTVSSQTLSAPSTISAYNEEGDFSYEFTLTINQESVGGWYSLIGWSKVGNVMGDGTFDDCDCCFVAPGSTLTYEVRGQLNVETSPGYVTNWVVLCPDDSTFQTSTTIMPYTPTPASPATWGRIKALYQR